MWEGGREIEMKIHTTVWTYYTIQSRGVMNELWRAENPMNILLVACLPAPAFYFQFAKAFGKKFLSRSITLRLCCRDPYSHSYYIYKILASFPNGFGVFSRVPYIICLTLLTQSRRGNVREPTTSCMLWKKSEICSYHWFFRPHGPDFCSVCSEHISRSNRKDSWRR